MDVHHFTTDALDPAERFGQWHDMTATTLLPTVLRSEHADDFHAEAHALDLGAVQVTTMRYRPLTSTRTPRLISLYDPGYYQLSLTLSGEMWISQAGRDTALGAGDLMVYDSSLPFHGGTRSEEGWIGHIVAQFPKALLPLPAREAERLVAVRMGSDSGFGAMLAQFLVRLAADWGSPQGEALWGASFEESEAPRLTRVMLDLLAGTAGRYLDAEGAPEPESRRHALFLRIQEFVRLRLADPELSPHTIAAAHHISVRYLHLLCQEHGVTVSGWIRDRRLDRARHDLADPAQRATPVHDIAARWGFRHHAAFSRAFRTAYDCTPSEFRECAQRQ
ncbi:helix-turn-helix domain-containing protein [Streptomyces sp. NBC_01353]|uniref:AraC-like ligand-binding domain-containing protein n=1 Tax=Streptomyces sp. NBC_01353 TaxID=2903835 RepID=UPI002E326423|nr:helix-turn-helix domain-containing protein [Streptomyces sp. NBC_01353]